MDDIYQEEFVIHLSDFRKKKDVYFGKDPDSPFTPNQKKTFKGLNYYPENRALRLELTIQELRVRETITMMTSKGSTQTYWRYGKIQFEVDGKEVELTVYQNENGFFLPFIDKMAGKETYPAGRYLEPEAIGKGKFRIDFNLAYNPYCAYNDQWSCPITPFENHLKISIRAGEKLYHDVEMSE